MNRFLQIVLASSAITVAATAANASVITWNFGTSGYSLVSPAGGSHAATTIGNTAAITPTNGQGAVFLDTSSLFGVTANAYATHNSPQPNVAGNGEKVTQSNDFSVDGSHLTGLGACDSNCGGIQTSIGDTEMLSLNLGSHSAAWTLGSITLENFTLTTSSNEAILWFSNSADGSSPHDATTLINSSSCAATGTDGSCTFNFSSISDPGLNGYSFLFVTAYNSDGDQPDIVVNQLTGNTVSVPEPATLSLFGAGLVAFGATRRRRRNV